jgi:hypothetical protein
MCCAVLWFAGKGSEIGDYLTTHSGVDCISFTGGDTGISISKKAGMVPLQMELGGKDACIVCRLVFIRGCKGGGGEQPGGRGVIVGSQNGVHGVCMGEVYTGTSISKTGRCGAPADRAGWQRCMHCVQVRLWLGTWSRIWVCGQGFGVGSRWGRGTARGKGGG